MPLVFLDLFKKNNAENQSRTLNEPNLGPWFGICGHCPVITLWLQRSLDAAPPLYKRFVLTVLTVLDYTGRNFGQATFCNNPLSGFLTLLGLSIGSPTTAINGLVASTTSLLVSMALRQPRDSLAAGLTGFNAVLLGTVLPNVLTMPSVWRWPIVCGTSALSAVLSNSLAQLLSSFRPCLPVLSLPFNLLGVLASLLLIASVPSTQLSKYEQEIQANNITLPVDYLLVLQGGVLGAGQVLAVQDWTSSGLIIAGMLLCSPLLTFSAIIGSIATTCVGAIAGPVLREAAYVGLHGYNGFLTASAMCFYFVPTWRSALLGVVGVTFTGALQLVLYSVMEHSAVPILSIPFVAATLLVLGVSSEGLPRPTLFSYPELHRALWLQARREERRDTRPSLSLDLNDPVGASTLQMTYSTTSMALESVSSLARSNSPNDGATSSADVSRTPVYRQTNIQIP